MVFACLVRPCVRGDEEHASDATPVVVPSAAHGFMTPSGMTHSATPAKSGGQNATPLKLAPCDQSEQQPCLEDQLLGTQQEYKLIMQWQRCTVSTECGTGATTISAHHSIDLDTRHPDSMRALHLTTHMPAEQGNPDLSRAQIGVQIAKLKAANCSEPGRSVASLDFGKGAAECPRPACSQPGRSLSIDCRRTDAWEMRPRLQSTFSGAASQQGAYERAGPAGSSPNSPGADGAGSSSERLLVLQQLYNGVLLYGDTPADVARRLLSRRRSSAYRRCSTQNSEAGSEPTSHPTSRTPHPTPAASGELPTVGELSDWGSAQPLRTQQLGKGPALEMCCELQEL